MPHRYFFRRALAYLVDALTVGIPLAIVAAALHSWVGLPVHAPSLINSKNCENVSIIAPEEQARLLPPGEGQIMFQVLCKVRYMMLTEQRILTMGNQLGPESGKNSRFISFQVDENGNQITTWSMDPLLYLILPFFLAMQLNRKGTTIGKRMLNLQVRNDNGALPTLSQGLKREFFKGLPLVLLALVYIWENIAYAQFSIEDIAELVRQYPLDGGPPIWPFFLRQALIGLAVFVFLLGSFIVWRGKTFWDRFAGTRCLKPEDEAEVQTSNVP